ncbi:hypothetical protein COLO4_36596 [Corchorus olitorius]|uniref:Uncharacterized protein n=1 Tax=Corchorus olitorius TaxID=93759 RepID=A0A1R3G7M7_9ROSI|nr:hypothetical protein COLO4_36596 [Corchorus olitorius]
MELEVGQKILPSLPFPDLVPDTANTALKHLEREAERKGRFLSALRGKGKLEG